MIASPINRYYLDDGGLFCTSSGFHLLHPVSNFDPKRRSPCFSCSCFCSFGANCATIVCAGHQSGKADVADPIPLDAAIYMAHWAFLAAYATFFMHVQVSTR